MEVHARIHTYSITALIRSTLHNTVYIATQQYTYTHTHTHTHNLTHHYLRIIIIIKSGFHQEVLSLFRASMACVKSWCISNTLFLLSKGPAAVCLVDEAAPELLATDEVDEEESDNTSTEALPFWYGSGLVGLGGGYTEPL